MTDQESPDPTSGLSPGSGDHTHVESLPLYPKGHFGLWLRGAPSAPLEPLLCVRVGACACRVGGRSAQRGVRASYAPESSSCGNTALGSWLPAGQTGGPLALVLPPIPPSIRVFSNESTLCMRWPKYWSFSNSFLQ